MKRTHLAPGLILPLLAAMALSACNRGQQTADQETAEAESREPVAPDAAPSPGTDEMARAETAARVLQSASIADEAAIPRGLLEKARAIAVVPRGTGTDGGHSGKGLVAMRRDDGSWSPPVFVEVGDARDRMQPGVMVSDLVLVFTEDMGIETLLEGRLKLGTDASVAPGPVGEGGEAAVTSAVYAYTRTSSGFEGAPLEGAVVIVDEGAHEDVYGRMLSPRDVLTAAHLAAPETVEPFARALRELAPANES